jgi:glycosyltransferase involved in cell wall biosynthesis
LKPLLSIVIPTKDRYRTLISLVKYLLSWDAINFEVVIQDNSSNNEPFRSFLETNKLDSRMRYFHEKDKLLTVVENSSLSIENSSGKYVCFLGDDDGIVCQILSVVHWMNINGVDSLNCSQGSYCWPECRVGTQGKKKSLAGMLLYRGYSGRVSSINLECAISELLEGGALRINNITRVYHGVVSRAVLNELKMKTGSFFPGPVADMSSAVGLSFYSKRHVFIDYPLITAGASDYSFAGKGRQRKNSTVLEGQTWLPKDTVQNWSWFLPKYLTVHTIWPESAVHALIQTGNEELINKLNINKIYAEFLVDCPELKTEFDIFLKNTYSSLEIANFLRGMKKYTLKYRVSKIKYFVKVYAVLFGLYRLLGLKKINAESVGEAMRLLEKNTTVFHLKKTDSDLSRILKKY